jgi:hypothetical protein
MRTHKLATIDATKEGELGWSEAIHAIASMSLLPTTKSWYMGDNIPGKKREALIYLGGVPTYHKTIHDVQDAGYDGFTLS